MVTMNLRENGQLMELAKGNRLLWLESGVSQKQRSKSSATNMLEHCRFVIFLTMKIRGVH